jgi:hypothetical protein
LTKEDNVISTFAVITASLNNVFHALSSSSLPRKKKLLYSIEKNEIKQISFTAGWFLTGGVRIFSTRPQDFNRDGM